MKTVLLVLANALAFVWRLMPDRLRLGGITGLLVLEHAIPSLRWDCAPSARSQPTRLDYQRASDGVWPRGAPEASADPIP